MNEFKDESKMKRFNFKWICFIDEVQYFSMHVYIYIYALCTSKSISYL